MSEAPSTTSAATLDAILTAQLAVAWAGEGGEEPRLKWWRTDLASEFGGEDLFKRVLPHTWPWAVLEGAREAARRHDADVRARDADPDRMHVVEIVHGRRGRRARWHVAVEIGHGGRCRLHLRRLPAM